MAAIGKSSAEVEERDLGASDIRRNGNTRALARMLKQWQRERNVCGLRLASYRHPARIPIEALTMPCLPAK